jgi:multimeric flavodoxin WrbA
MKILGFLGSPRLDGNCSKLLRKALDGAESTGAETKLFEVINYNIMDCRGCSSCFLNNPDLLVGECILKDDAASILQEYVKADGYLFASPVYDGYITALLKRFLERKIALSYRAPGAEMIMPFSRVPANFKRKASMIVTSNCSDEFGEAMGGPCYEAMEAHLMLEQVDTVDKLYVGSVETITEKDFSERMNTAYQMGIRLVKEVEKAGKLGDQ